MSEEEVKAKTAGQEEMKDCDRSRVRWLRGGPQGLTRDMTEGGAGLWASPHPRCGSFHEHLLPAQQRTSKRSSSRQNQVQVYFEDAPPREDPIATNCLLGNSSVP